MSGKYDITLTWFTFRLFSKLPVLRSNCAYGQSVLGICSSHQHILSFCDSFLESKMINGSQRTGSQGNIIFTQEDMSDI